MVVGAAVAVTQALRLLVIGGGGGGAGSFDPCNRILAVLCTTGKPKGRDAECPSLSEGAISLDGGIIRNSGVDLLGNRQDVDVHFSSTLEVTESPANYQELQEKVTGLKSRREKVLEDHR